LNKIKAQVFLCSLYANNAATFFIFIITTAFKDILPGLMLSALPFMNRIIVAIIRRNAVLVLNICLLIATTEGYEKGALFSRNQP
jgi:hypothetical protein